MSKEKNSGMVVESGYWIPRIAKLDDGSFYVEMYNSNSGVTQGFSYPDYASLMIFLKENFNEGPI